MMVRVITFWLAGLLWLTGCASGAPAQAPEPPPDAPVLELSAEVEDGRAVPNAEQVRVEPGTWIRIEVTGDRFDELHAHGYDVAVNVVPGEPSTLEFLADRTGRFEIEFHEIEQLVFQLLVTS